MRYGGARWLHYALSANVTCPGMRKRNNGRCTGPNLEVSGTRKELSILFTCRDTYKILVT